MDLLAPDEILLHLSQITPLDYKDIFDLTLKKYDGFAYEKLQTNSYTQNISALGIKHRSRSKFGQLYCSSCLSKKPFYKLSWRLETSIVCVDCKEYLKDHCPSCKSPISFYRINFNKKNLAIKDVFYCSFCLYDLRTNKNESAPSSEELEYQHYINTILNKGFNEISNYSFTYIKILLLLCSKLNTANPRNQFKINFSQLYKINQTDTSNYFRFLPIEQKRSLLVNVNKFLRCWPYSFFQLKKIKHFNNSHITENMEKLPYWFTYYLKFDS